jgi:hypothetical protein
MSMDNPETTKPKRSRAASIGRRVAITAVVLCIWFWTQHLIGARQLPAGGAGIGDQLHVWTAGANHYLSQHRTAADFLLITSSGIIDLLGLFLLGSWIFGRSVRPFAGLVIVLGLRQIMQALVALPAPEGAIWHYPGFPSLLVTYGVANDFFFSGHTAIAVLGAAELARIGKRWLTSLAVLIAVFEISTVIILRAHYTMDVFTGAVTALYAVYLAGIISVSIDRRLGT